MTWPRARTAALELAGRILAAWTVAVPAAGGEPPAGEESEGRPAATFAGETTVEARVPASAAVATKFPLALARTPASVSVVEGRDLSERGARVLGEALVAVPGINVQSQVGVTDFFVSRGLDSVAAGLVLIDGAREPEASWYQLYDAERVEALRGPAAFVYGGGALGGAINVVRRRPQPMDAWRVGLAGGSFATREADFDGNWAGQAGELALRVAGVARETDGYRDGRRGEDRALHPTVAWRPGAATSVEVSFEAQRLDHAPDAGLPVAGETVAALPRRRSYQSPLDFSTQEITRLELEIEARLGPTGAVTLREKAYRRRLDWRSRSTIFNGILPVLAGEPLLARSLLDLDDEQTFTANLAEVLWAVGPPRARHHVLAGIELAELADRFAFGAALLPVISVASDGGGPRGPLLPLPGLDRAADATSRVVAPYLVDQLRLGRASDLFLGLRFDRVDFCDRASGVDRRDEELSPMVGLAVAAGQGVTLYGSVSEAFAPPSTFAVAAGQRPEESAQRELGVKLERPQGGWRVALAAYRLARDGIAIPDATGVNRQTGRQRSAGVELEVAVEPRSRAAAPAGGRVGGGAWRLEMAYAYTDAELVEFRQLRAGPVLGEVVDLAGNRPAFSPEHLASLHLRRRLPAGWTAGGSGRWVGRQFIAEDNRLALPATVSAGLWATWRRRGWRLDLGADNVTGETIYTRGFGAESVVPAPGPTLRWGLHYEVGWGDGSGTGASAGQPAARPPTRP